MKNQDHEARIAALLKEMTLEEKVGQLRQCGPSIVGAFEVSFSELLDMMFDGKISKEEFDRLMSSAEQDYREEDLRAGRIGSYNGISDAATADRLQRIAVEESRLGIPAVRLRRDPRFPDRHADPARGELRMGSRALGAHGEGCGEGGDCGRGASDVCADGGCRKRRPLGQGQRGCGRGCAARRALRHSEG